MLTKLHKNPGTTLAIRRELRESKLPIPTPAAKYNLNHATVRKWRSGESTEDRSHPPRKRSRHTQNAVATIGRPPCGPSTRPPLAPAWPAVLNATASPTSTTSSQRKRKRSPSIRPSTRILHEILPENYLYLIFQLVTICLRLFSKHRLGVLTLITVGKISSGRTLPGCVHWLCYQYPSLLLTGIIRLPIISSTISNFDEGHTKMRL